MQDAPLQRYRQLARRLAPELATEKLVLANYISDWQDYAKATSKGHQQLLLRRRRMRSSDACFVRTASRLLEALGKLFGLAPQRNGKPEVQAEGQVSRACRMLELPVTKGGSGVWARSL